MTALSVISNGTAIVDHALSIVDRAVCHADSRKLIKRERIVHGTMEILDGAEKFCSSRNLSYRNRERAEKLMDVVTYAAMRDISHT